GRNCSTGKFVGEEIKIEARRLVGSRPLHPQGARSQAGGAGENGPAARPVRGSGAAEGLPVAPLAGLAGVEQGRRAPAPAGAWPSAAGARKGAAGGNRRLARPDGFERGTEGARTRAVAQSAVMVEERGSAAQAARARTNAGG